jgi:hypothetical protein
MLSAHKPLAGNSCCCPQITVPSTRCAPAATTAQGTVPQTAAIWFCNLYIQHTTLHIVSTHLCSSMSPRSPLQGLPQQRANSDSQPISACHPPHSRAMWRIRQVRCGQDVLPTVAQVRRAWHSSTYGTAARTRHAIWCQQLHAGSMQNHAAAGQRRLAEQHLSALAADTAEDVAAVF